MISKNSWLVFSHKWSRGDDDPCWYRPKAKGYTSSFLTAGSYSEEGAKKETQHSHGQTEAVKVLSPRFYELVKRHQMSLDAARLMELVLELEREVTELAEEVNSLKSGMGHN